MSLKLPTNTKVIIIKESKVPRKPLYHDASLIDRPLSPPQPGEIIVKIAAVGLNHKDVRDFPCSPCYIFLILVWLLWQVWLRKGQFPDVTIGAVFGCDGAGRLALKLVSEAHHLFRTCNRFGDTE